MMYWIVFAFFTAVENAADVFISWYALFLSCCLEFEKIIHVIKPSIIYFLPGMKIFIAQMCFPVQF